MKDEIKVMDMFKKTLIDGYGGKRLAWLKGCCYGKPNSKALRSFQASGLKMMAKVGQK